MEGGRYIEDLIRPKVPKHNRLEVKRKTKIEEIEEYRIVQDQFNMTSGKSVC